MLHILFNPLFILPVILPCTVVLSAEVKGCPTPDVLGPCTCYHFSTDTILTCKDIDNPDLLSNVFILSSSFRYSEVHIMGSVLQYLPADMFQGVQIQRLYLKNVTLTELFDDPPTHLQMLEALYIENTNVFGGMSWELLKPMHDLRILTVYYDVIPYLGDDFKQEVTDKLEQITFYGTETSDLQSGVFKDFNKLDKVAFDACGITEITRDIFPRPFLGRVIYFNDNKLTSIPDDMFVGMPNLQTLGLRKNQIQVLPVTAFDPALTKLEYFMLEGNPINCDCRLLWLIRSKPKELSGKCWNLRRKDLKDVQTYELICPN